MNQSCSIFLLQETENWLLSVRWKILATPRLFKSCQRSCGITQKTRPHCRRSKFQSDIYVPMCWIDLSFNSRVILDFFLFWNYKLQNAPKKFRIKLSTYLASKGFILEIVLDFDPKILSFKKRESHPQINSALEWAHKCHSSSRSLHYWQRNGRSNYWKNQKNGRKLCWFASKCYAYCFFLLLT